MSATTLPADARVERESLTECEALNAACAAAPAVGAPVVVRAVTGAADRAAWERYVSGCPRATLFHHPAWSDAVVAAFGHRPRHLLAWQGSQLIGVLPLMEVNSIFAGCLLVSVPYGTYGGILGEHPAVYQALAAAAIGLAEECNARVVDLRSAEADAPGFEPVEGYLGFARELPTTPEGVAAFLPKRARAAARHARDRDGLVVRHDPAQLPLVWQLYCRSMRRLSSLNYPYKFFVALFERFREQAWASVAWDGSRPVCGTVSFVFRDTVMPYVLGADERCPREGAANLLYWSIMERAVALGLRRFDYGRSRADNRGAIGFKKNQGFEPRPLGYQRYVPRGWKAPDLRPSNPRFAPARRIWARLPLAVTRPLGAWLARSIPG